MTVRLPPGTLIQVEGPPGRARPPRVVGDHDDVLPWRVVRAASRFRAPRRRLYDRIPSGSCRGARRVVHNRARDADSRCLAAGQLPRIMLRPVGTAPRPSAQSRPASGDGLREPVSSSGNSTFRSAVTHRQQFIELEDEADVSATPPRELAAVSELMRTPPPRPAPGGRIESPHQIEQCRLFQSPTGPIAPDKSPLGISRLTPSRTSMRSLPRVKCLWTFVPHEGLFAHLSSFARRGDACVAPTRLTSPRHWLDHPRSARQRGGGEDDAFAGAETGQHFHAVASGGAGRHGAGDRRRARGHEA